MGGLLSVLLLAVAIPASLAARSEAFLRTSGVVRAASIGSGQKPSGSAEQPVQDEKSPGKTALTPAQRKLDSHLLYEIEVQRGKPRRAIRSGRALVTVDDQGRALVEIRARILTQLGWKIERLRGTVVSASPQYRSMMAWVPLLKLETLASESIVSAIAPAPKSITVRPQH